MIDTAFETLSTLASSFQSHPITFTVATTIAVTLIVLKWHFLGQIFQNSIKNNSAGWHTKGVTSRAGSTTMRPYKFRLLGFTTLCFFGGGTYFIWFFVLPKETAGLEEWFMFLTSAVFSLGAIYILAKSFDQICFDEEQITIKSLFSRPYSAALQDVDTITPLSKTIASGITIKFNDGRQIKVIARMTGYRGLLRTLAKRDLKLRLMLSVIEQSQEGKSDA